MSLPRATTGSTASCLQIEQLAAGIRKADALIVGAGAGLSTAAGFTYSGPRFYRHFADFHQKYGFTDMYAGGFYPYATPEEYWAYWSRYILINRYSQPPGRVYSDLLALVRGKDYFVLTTNVDHCFQKAGFDKQRLFYTQGDYGLWQCQKPCHYKTYDNGQTVRQMVARQRDMRVPTELIPRCPVCGGLMTMNLRVDSCFVEDVGWHAAAGRYRDFLHRHQNGAVLYLELGVGGNTPGIIKYPFWQFTARQPRSTYVSVNTEKQKVPHQLQDRALCIQGDIAPILKQVKNCLKAGE